MYASDAPVSYPPLLSDLSDVQLIAAWQHALRMHRLAIQTHGHCDMQSSRDEISFYSGQLRIVEDEIRRRDPDGIWSPETSQAAQAAPSAPMNPWLFGAIGVGAVCVLGALMAWGIPAMIRAAAWLIAWDLSL